MSRAVVTQGYGVCISGFKKKVTYKDLRDFFENYGENLDEFDLAFKAARSIRMAQDVDIRLNDEVGKLIFMILGYKSFDEFIALKTVEYVTRKYDLPLIADKNDRNEWFVILPAKYPWEKMSETERSLTKEGFELILKPCIYPFMDVNADIQTIISYEEEDWI